MTFLLCALHAPRTCPQGIHLHLVHLEIQSLEKESRYKKNKTMEGFAVMTTIKMLIMKHTNNTPQTQEITGSCQ